MSLHITPLMVRICELSMRPEGVCRYDLNHCGRAVRYINTLVEAGYLSVSTRGEGRRKMKVYRSTGKPVPPVSPQRKAQPPTINVKAAGANANVVFKASLTERKKRFSPGQPALVTSKTKFIRCPSRPVYSNVQVAPGEPVPAVFSGRLGLDPLTWRPWA